MNLNNVNKRNTKEWAFFNGNSRSANNRAKFLEKHGGEFKRVGAEWVWESKVRKTMEFAMVFTYLARTRWNQMASKTTAEALGLLKYI